MRLAKTILMLVCVMGAAVSQAATWTVTTGSQQARLVELFTSEGCSSCPPADGWLSGLKRQPDLFESLVPVAYHVTYWDYLGWEDTLGLKAHDDRHRRQAADANAAVYTPGVFLQGREWRHWRRHSEVPADHAALHVGVLRANAQGGTVNVSFAPVAGVKVTEPEVFVTYLRMDQSTHVRAGENRGRELKHDFVAGAVASRPMQRQADLWRASVPLPPSGRADAVAVWIKEATGVVLQAGGGYLSVDTERSTPAAALPD